MLLVTVLNTLSVHLFSSICRFWSSPCPQQVCWIDIQTLDLYKVLLEKMPRQAAMRAFCGVLQRTWATVGHWGVEMEHVAESPAPATHAAAQTEGESLSPKATDSPPCRTYPTLAREPLAVSPLSSRKFGRACVEYIKFARKMASPHRHGIEVHTHPVKGCAACYKKMHLATYDMCFKTLQLESATKREVVHDVCTPPGSPSPCTHGVFETSFICAAITALELS
jgi:hypothetical protein